MSLLGCASKAAVACLGMTLLCSAQATACCPAPREGALAVNADQTVILLWDAEAGVEHFIRQADFRGNDREFGFIVPTPAEPELAESGSEAFPILARLTAPLVKSSGGGMSMGCAASGPSTAGAQVQIVQEKRFAGFDAVVLRAESGRALGDWLRDHDYANSPELQDWAQPYIAKQWFFTAMKIAKSADQPADLTVRAAALRLSFKTDRPLFPYREPDYKGRNELLGAKTRLLRLFVIAEERQTGHFEQDDSWTGQVTWAGPIGPRDQKRLLNSLQISTAIGQTPWYLTEFEDHWPYSPAPSDLYFSRSADQSPVARPMQAAAAEASQADATLVLMAAFVGVPFLAARRRL